MTEWSVINSEEALDSWDWEEYASSIRRRQTDAHWRAIYEEALVRVASEIDQRRRRK